MAKSESNTAAAAELNGDVVDDKKQTSNFPPPPDGGVDAWLSVLGACLMFLVTAGTVRSFPIVYHALQQRYDSTVTETGLVSIANSASKMLCSPVIGVAINRYGERVVTAVGGFVAAVAFAITGFMPSVGLVYVTYGAMAGIGANAVVVSALSMLSKNFKKRKGRVMGASQMFMGVGGMLFPLLFERLFVWYGYVGGMALLGGITLHYLVIAALFRPLFIVHQVEKKAKRSTEMVATMSTNSDTESPPLHDVEKRRSLASRLLNVELLRKPDFVFFCGCVMMSLFGTLHAINSFLAGLTQELGMTQEQLVFLLLLGSAMDFPSKLLTGVIFDLKCVRHRRVVPFLVLGFFASGCVFFIALSVDAATLYVSFCAYSFFRSAFQSQAMTVLTDMVEPHQTSSAIALCRFFQGIGIITLPLVGGIIADSLQTLKFSFLLFAGLFTLGLTIFTVQLVIRKGCCRRPAGGEQAAVSVISTQT